MSIRGFFQKKQTKKILLLNSNADPKQAKRYPNPEKNYFRKIGMAFKNVYLKTEYKKYNFCHNIYERAENAYFWVIYM